MKTYEFGLIINGAQIKVRVQAWNSGAAWLAVQKMYNVTSYATLEEIR